MLSYGVHDLQEGGVLPGIGRLAYDVSAAVPLDSWYGTLLKGVFNFSPAATWLEVAVWVAYVAIVGTCFVLALRPPPRPAPRRGRRRRALTGTRRIRIPPLRGTAMPSSPLRLVAAAVAVLALAGCTAKPAPASRTVTVTASDDACRLSAATAASGRAAFTIRNTGTRSTEFELLAADGATIAAEVENLAPGLTRTLTLTLAGHATPRSASPG